MNNVGEAFNSAINSVHRGLVVILRWPLHRSNRIVHCIIHRRVGYDVIVEDPPSRLICAKCNCVPSVPKKTTCGKTLCRRCARQLDRCPFCHSPTCRAPRSQEHAQEINKLTVRCPNIGDYNSPRCKWEGKICEVADHLKQCQYATIKCQQCGKAILRIHQFKHKDCCPRQKINCFYCKKEGYARDILIHEETECYLRKVPCPNECGDLDVFHDQLEDHVRWKCPLRPVLCTRCNEAYAAEDLEQHRCIPPRSRSSVSIVVNRPTEPINTEQPSQPMTETRQPSSPPNTPPSAADDPQHQRQQMPTEAAADAQTNLQIKVPISGRTSNNNKSKTEVLQRLAVSYITLCLLSLVAYLRNHRNDDTEVEHNMEIPSVLMWSMFTSSVVFLGILGGSNCYKNLFKAIYARECIVIALLANFVHLIRFYPNNCLPMILGSLSGAAVEIFLFLKYIERHPSKFTETVWVMTQFTAIVLAPFMVIYHSSISNVRMAVMQLVYVMYIVVLKEKRQLELRWNGMTQENRTISVYLLNGAVLFSVTLYSVTVVAYELFSASFSSLKVVLALILPFAYLYILANEDVQDKLLEFGEKLYKSSIYSFWGRVCMVSIFYYTTTFCLIIPIIQDSGDFFVGSALASIIIVYCIIVQAGLLSKDGLEQVLKESTPNGPDKTKSKGVQLSNMVSNCPLLLKLRFEEKVVNHYDANPNTTTLKIYVELERINNSYSTKSTATRDVTYEMSLTVVNNQWVSSNEIIRFSSEDISGTLLKQKLGCTCLELRKWQRYVNFEDAITLDIKLNKHLKL